MAPPDAKQSLSASRRPVTRPTLAHFLSRLRSFFHLLPAPASMTQLIILPLAVQHAARVPRPHRTQNDAADDELLFDGWPTSVSFPQLLEKLVPAAARNRFAINIGAADGKNPDPTYPLFRDLGYAGVAIEGSARVMGTLHANLAAVNSSGRLRVVHGFADPATIASVVTSAGAPKDADVLKIDIDSIDMPVLHALLSGAGMRPANLYGD